MNAYRFAVICFLLLLVPGASFAHSPIEGIGNFYNGVLHPVLVPAHLLLLVAVGLFIGQQGGKAIQPALGAFGFATIVGLTVAWFLKAGEAEVLILVLSAVIGLLIAVEIKIGVLWCGLIALLGGLLLGIDSAQGALSGEDKLVNLFGSGIAIYLLVLYPMSLAEFLSKKTWQKIGIRVVGSWVSASSLLVLALSFAPQISV